ncbi:antibiotic biosynthesis monooxygenase [Micromonospora sp. ALFpr18c]|uniref:putative quinol monooxygenase n=1 Tax=unclassified Micromonospora TaxID=2617518 RepID=UPI00124B40F1|nr:MULTISPECIES: putative quinol monooxygenase [unclassified Micromonospora]KAB1929879.1 antibiotic biosynthesis monooxygenase [Micromonospora sp. ALFpr18c]MDG4761447.1 putative quinol monooxygenase [Micromonospora sp. WMMD710]
MLIITARFRVRPEDAEQWPETVAALTRATRAEAGCLWFDWSRSVDDPNEYILIESYRDEAAMQAHLQSDHFRQAQRDLPPRLAETVQTVRATIAQDGWTPFPDLAVPAGNS